MIADYLSGSAVTSLTDYQGMQLEVTGSVRNNPPLVALCVSARLSLLVMTDDTCVSGVSRSIEDAFYLAKAHQLGRINGVAAMRYDCPSKGILPSGAIPEELSRVSTLRVCYFEFLVRCHVHHKSVLLNLFSRDCFSLQGSTTCAGTAIAATDSSYTLTTLYITSVVLHAELLLRRGDASLYRNGDSMLGQQPGSIRQAVFFVISNSPSWPWPSNRNSVMEYLYRFYRDGKFLEQLTTAARLHSSMARVRTLAH